MRLVDLKPEWLGHGGEGVTDAAGNPVPRREGVGVEFDCPCGNHDEDHRCFVFVNPPLDGGSPVDPHSWKRTGDTFETLTLTPSIFRRGNASCGWHGFITDGEVRTF